MKATLVQGYKVTHINFKACKEAHSKILHRTVHRINKEPPHNTAAHMAKQEVLPCEIRVHLVCWDTTVNREALIIIRLYCWTPSLEK